ncbi:DUF3006 domain-containing protein [Metabacillus fastidiosus]|uniref:DUF3006 domain-containing protein n=1 Tax=Metabacillus fastidiosus TaxID=1458 RepID=UPI002DBB8B11|nr:DUF3006 domain-containing protein [Metabacillus fastidiosus]MEC2075746.1 DUF3006 domain-containing protein [Metabacillus fastidiosus]
MRTNIYTIDRFERDFAVLLLREDETVQIDVPRHKLPEYVKEGMILSVFFDKEGNIANTEVFEAATEAAHENAQQLLEKIMNKNK